MTIVPFTVCGVSFGCHSEGTYPISRIKRPARQKRKTSHNTKGFTKS